MEKRNFLDINDLSSKDLTKIIEKAIFLKSQKSSSSTLEGKQLAMIFEKESTRTRVSFEVGMSQLGGNAILINGRDSQISRGEDVKDTALVLSRYVDIIMIRTFEHQFLLDLAENATIPVINGLTDSSHPCQVMADILTINEHLGDIKNKTITWIGDINNMTNSWIHAALVFGFELRLSSPESLQPKQKLPQNVTWYKNPIEAAESADVVTTDTWISMGDSNADEKKKIFSGYKVTNEIMASAKSSAIFLHCLPAHREEEVSSDVIDGKQSVIYDEAENRLHIQKTIMLWCLNKID